MGNPADMNDEARRAWAFAEWLALIPPEDRQAAIIRKLVIAPVLADMSRWRDAGVFLPPVSAAGEMVERERRGRLPLTAMRKRPTDMAMHEWRLLSA